MSDTSAREARRHVVLTLELLWMEQRRPWYESQQLTCGTIVDLNLLGE